MHTTSDSQHHPHAKLTTVNTTHTHTKLPTVNTLIQVPGVTTGFLKRTPRNQFNVDFDELEGHMEAVSAPMQLRELCKECLSYEMDERAASDDVADWLTGLVEEMEEVGPPRTEIVFVHVQCVSCSLHV